MRKIKLLKIIKLLALGIVVILAFTIKKNNSSDQKSFLGQKFMPKAEADTIVGCVGVECSFNGEGAGTGEGGCY